MKAQTYQQYGNTSVLELTDQPMPKVGPGEVLVQVKAAGINPVDWKVMSGGLDPMMNAQFPAGTSRASSWARASTPPASPRGTR